MKLLLIFIMALAFFGGLYLAINILQDKKPPLSAAGIHGIIALLLIVLLIYFAYTLNTTKLWVALGLLIAASFGGLYLVRNHKNGNLGPKSAVYIHAFIALVGLLLILTSIL